MVIEEQEALSWNAAELHQSLHSARRTRPGQQRQCLEQCPEQREPMCSGDVGASSVPKLQSQIEWKTQKQQLLPAEKHLRV